MYGKAEAQSAATTVPTVSAAPIRSAATAAPRIDPRPPTTVTMKAPTMIEPSIPGVTAICGEMTAPPRPARSAPSAKTTVNSSLRLTPLASSSSGSSTAARIRQPSIVRLSRSQRTTPTPTAVPTTMMLYFGIDSPAISIDPKNESGYGTARASAPQMR